MESDFSTVNTSMDSKVTYPVQNVDKMETGGNGFPTASHGIVNGNSNDDHPHHGAAQVLHNGVEVHDLGWSADPEDYEEPLIDDLSNEQVWTLVRRFNKQMFHVKATHQTASSVCVDHYCMRH